MKRMAVVTALVMSLLGCGQAKPPAYFAFACKPIGPARVQELAQQYGSNILIGIDPNYEGFETTLQQARQQGARLHVYLEGPGGPTGEVPEGSSDPWAGWEASERQRVTQAAAALGLDVNTPSGLKQWRRGGWKEHCHRQCQQYKAAGFASAELDNLYQGLGEEDEPLISFLAEYSQWYAQGDVPSLLLKNVNRSQWLLLQQALQAGKVQRQALSDFHIWEKSAGEWEGQDQLSAQVGIQTLVSTDTYNYGAEGAYQGLKTAK